MWDMVNNCTKVYDMTWLWCYVWDCRYDGGKDLGLRGMWDMVNNCMKVYDMTWLWCYLWDSR